MVMTLKTKLNLVSAILSLVAVVIGVMIYLAIRFEWKFAVAAIIANLHDVVIILGFFAFFQWEFSLAVLAAVLRRHVSTIPFENLDVLLGRPIRFSEHCKTLGTVGDIQLVDPKGYYALTKAGGIKFASSIHLYFDYGLQAFRWTIRLGGQPHLAAPVSPANGSTTKSHFVALATRA